MTFLFIALHVYAAALRFLPPPATILMMQRHAAGAQIKRDWVPLTDISPHMVRAVMGGEDSRFCEHHGLDWNAVKSAYQDNQASGRRRGGSTITQQTAKNVFLWNGGGWVRKLPEVWMASFIDYVWGKPRVMEIYLNVAEWGDGIFGVEAAAQTRFGVAAKDLSPRQAALLASVLPSPNKWRVDPSGPYVSARAETLLQRMAIIKSSQYDGCVNQASPRP